MTMQVGMLASDGIILASDTLASRSPLAGITVRAIRQTFGTSKVRISGDSKVAVTCARDLLQAYHLADALIAGLPQEYWDNPESKMREIALSEVNRQHWRGAECLIALAEPSPSLYLLQCITDSQESVCHRIITYVFAGDSANASSYWAMRYYDSLNPELRRTDKLVPLAAQIVVDASRFNSAIVGGLEIVVCDGSGIRRFTEQENSKQHSLAVRRGDEIEAILFPPETQT
jgi:hypothetical protein